MDYNNNHKKELSMYRYDYGVPVVFDAGESEGFSIGDKIIFVFASDVIADKVFVVNKSDFSFELKLTKDEADRLPAKPTKIHYSAKRYNESNNFLETLIDSDLEVKGTVKWQG